MIMGKIDFVLAWVDGSDPSWIVEKKKYENKGCDSVGLGDANSQCRYRDDGLLKYWFRCVENNAPWVNKIHFVTCGQKPIWLVENHPKLNLVNHSDYIPSQYLPTFNANTIEMNFHRIDSLSEQYVYFNDDEFILQELTPDFFFKNGQPVLETNLKYSNKVGYNNWSRLVFNDYCVVNRSFDIRKSIWKNRGKWFNIAELGMKRARQNFLCYIANKTLPVGLYGHVALPHLKSTLQEIWDACPDIMTQAMMHKFRMDDQVNQWLLCAWNQAKGSFYPTHENKIGKNFSLSTANVDKLCEAIKSKQFPQICINDTKKNTEPERCFKLVSEAFESILPNKSSFEKA